MWETIGAIHKALRIESTWAFVLLMALGAALIAAIVVGAGAWVIDAGYKNSPEYKAEHPPKRQTVTVSNSASQSVAVQGSSMQGVQGATLTPDVAQKKATSAKAKKPARLKQNVEVAIPQPIPPPLPGMVTCGDGTFVLTPNDCAVGPMDGTIKIVNNYIEGGPVNVFHQDTRGCQDGKTSTGQPCGLKDVEVRNNTFFNPGNGSTAVLPPNSHQAFAEGNTYVNASQSSRPVVELNGEDVQFRKNRVENENFMMAPTTKRAVIYDNIFVADTVLRQVDDGKEQLETVLSYVRSAFEEHWKSLSDANYRANEELLAQFEKSAREKPFDREITRTLLQKVIDATPRQP